MNPLLSLNLEIAVTKVNWRDKLQGYSLKG